MLRRTLGLVALVGSVTACGSGGGSAGVAAQQDKTPPASAPAVADSRLTAQDWRLESLGAVGQEKPIRGGTLITLEFGTDGWVDGFAGCNTYRTTYKPGAGGELDVRALVRSSKRCLDAIEMQETTYLDILHRVETYEVEDRRLRLFYEGGSRNLIFRGVPDASVEKPEVTPSPPIPEPVGQEDNSGRPFR